MRRSAVRDVRATTARERDVAGLAVQGLPPWTVQGYLKRVFAKSGVAGRTELAAALFGTTPLSSVR